MLKWGDHVPSRYEILSAQGFLCKGSDGSGCPKERDWVIGHWMTVVVVGDSFRGVCRSCYAKITAGARGKKIAHAIAVKRAQLRLPLGSRDRK
jgi:hypothetical protein